MLCWSSCNMISMYMRWIWKRKGWHGPARTRGKPNQNKHKHICMRERPTNVNQCASNIDWAMRKTDTIKMSLERASRCLGWLAYEKDTKSSRCDHHHTPPTRARSRVHRITGQPKRNTACVFLPSPTVDNVVCWALSFSKSIYLLLFRRPPTCWHFA